MVTVKNARNISKKTKGKTEPELKYRRKKDKFQSVSIYGKNATTISVEGPKIISVMVSKKVGYLTLTTRESVEFLEHRTDKIKLITIKVEAGKYYVSMTYERTKRQVAKPPENTLIALDLGVKYNVKWYDGTNSGTWLFNTEKSKKSEKLSQSMKLAKHHEGSKRYLKALQLQQRRACRAANQRLYQVDLCIAWLCQNYHVIAIDDFSFKAALSVAKNKEVYCSMKGAFLSRLKSKAEEYGTILLFVPHQKGVKTTHVCSCCGSTGVTVDWNTRELACPECGLVIDRDENGAINTYNWALTQ